MAKTTRVEQKSRKVKRTQYSVTWATANNRYSTHKGRIPRADKRGYPIGHGYGPEGVKATVAGETVMPTQTHVPATSATGVSRTANIVVTWSESMNPKAIGITVQPSGGAEVPGTLTYVEATKIATFDPASTLPANTQIFVQVRGADVYGNASATNTYQFTTGA
jgi:hypothetical protein